MWLVDDVLDSTDTEHFHPLRKHLDRCFYISGSQLGMIFPPRKMVENWRNFWYIQMGEEVLLASYNA